MVNNQWEMGDLPFHVVIYLFDYLNLKDASKSRRVCQQFNRAFAKTRCKTLDIADYYHSSWTSSTFTGFMKHVGPEIRTLVWSNFNNVADKNLEQFMWDLPELLKKYCPNLVELRLPKLESGSHGRCFWTAVSRYPSYFKRLQSLTFASIPIYELSKFPQLNRFNGNLLQYQEKKDLPVTVWRKLSNLEELSNLHGRLVCSLANSAKMQGWDVPVIKGYRGSVEIDTHMINNAVRNSAIFDSISRMLPNVQSFSCILSQSYNFQIIAPIANRIIRLKLDHPVDHRDSEIPPDKNIDDDRPTFSNLESLEIVTLQKLPNNPNLFSFLSNVTELKTLRMHYFGDVDCRFVYKFLNSSAPLEQLEIINCNYDSNDLTSWLCGCRFNQLRRLELRESDVATRNVRVEQLSAIFQASPELECLVIEKCSRIHDEIFETILIHLTNLKQLKINFTPVTGRGFVKFAEHWTEKHKLTSSGGGEHQARELSVKFGTSMAGYENSKLFAKAGFVMTFESGSDYPFPLIGFVLKL